MLERENRCEPPATLQALAAIACHGMELAAAEKHLRALLLTPLEVEHLNAVEEGLAPPTLSQEKGRERDAVSSLIDVGEYQRARRTLDAADWAWHPEWTRLNTMLRFIAPKAEEPSVDPLSGTDATPDCLDVITVLQSPDGGALIYGRGRLQLSLLLQGFWGVSDCSLLDALTEEGKLKPGARLRHLDVGALLRLLTRKSERPATPKVQS